VTQVREALESIDALKQMPVVDDVVDEAADEESKVDSKAAAVIAVDKAEAAPAKASQPEATHINFYTWLRLMAQRYEQERNQRAAAVRLMFETASIGALTPQTPFSPEVEGVQQHVEFPQFQSVLRTLCPNIDLCEIAHIYGICFDEGNKFVTAEVFMRVADKRHIFRSNRLYPQNCVFYQCSKCNIVLYM